MPPISTSPAFPLIDFSVNVPPPVIDEASFTEASQLAARRLAALPSGGLYHHNGTPEARSVIADWLTRTDVRADPDELILCNGAQQAIHLALAGLARHSRVIASEAQTFSGAILGRCRSRPRMGGGRA